MRWTFSLTSSLSTTDSTSTASSSVGRFFLRQQSQQQQQPQQQQRPRERRLQEPAPEQPVNPVPVPAEQQKQTDSHVPNPAVPVQPNNNHTKTQLDQHFVVSDKTQPAVVVSETAPPETPKVVADQEQRQSMLAPPGPPKSEERPGPEPPNPPPVPAVPAPEPPKVEGGAEPFPQQQQQQLKSDEKPGPAPISLPELPKPVPASAAVPVPEPPKTEGETKPVPQQQQPQEYKVPELPEPVPEPPKGETREGEPVAVIPSVPKGEPGPGTDNTNKMENEEQDPDLGILGDELVLGNLLDDEFALEEVGFQEKLADLGLYSLPEDTPGSSSSSSGTVGDGIPSHLASLEVKVAPGEGNLELGKSASDDYVIASDQEQKPATLVLLIAVFFGACCLYQRRRALLLTHKLNRAEYQKLTGQVGKDN